MNLCENMRNIIIIPKKRKSRYIKRTLDYRTASDNYPVKLAAREALKSYSEYYYCRDKFHHIHHPLIPFESILEVFMDDYPDGIPIAYIHQRYEFEAILSQKFAEFHDNIIKNHKGAELQLLTPEEHLKIHKLWKKERKEQEIIEKWIKILRNERKTMITIGELFCGAGGIALGAKNVGIKSLWAIDYDKDACKTYQLNICPNETDTVICADVRNVDFTSLPKVNGLAFGFPCNDFSMVGKKQGFEGKYGRLYEYCVKAVSIHKPEFFFAENVQGFLSNDNGNAIKTILKDFEDLGYKLYMNLYKFENYGLPQTRHRVIIVGFRNDINYEFKIPQPTNEKMSCGEALNNIPENAYNNEKPNHSAIVTERIKYIKQGENAYTADIPPELQLKVRFGNHYYRLNPDKPAPTITASGGGICHFSENRVLTNRERARIQTFPDDFKFVGGVTSVKRQIGMAVPPKGAEIVFKAILESLKDYYDSNM